MDITERIDLETSLEQQRQLAEESSRHKSRLMSAMSHDARTPLNAVSLSAQLLEMHVQGQADPAVVTEEIRGEPAVLAVVPFHANEDGRPVGV